MQNRAEIIKPDYSLSLQGDILPVFMLQVLFIVVAFVKPMDFASTLFVILIPLGIVLPLVLLQYYQGWGRLYLDQDGIRIRQFWGEQVYSWHKVDSIYMASVSTHWNNWELWYGKARKIYIMLSGCDMGCALTSYPYAGYTVGQLAGYLNHYRDRVLAAAS